jgi:diguanylate cyclase (GGDEF)-like protein/PAS domain S-box-containing protein
LAERATGPGRSHRALLESGASEAFERITRLVAMTLRAPYALLALRVGERLHVVSETGLPLPWSSSGELPLALETLCLRTLEGIDPLVLEDTTQLATGGEEALRVGSYCGVPLRSGGEVVGVLCMARPDSSPWSESEVEMLVDLAAGAEDELAARLAPAPVELLESASVGFTSFDADWRCTFVNAAAAQILGRDRENLIGRRFWEEIPELVGTLFHSSYVRVMEDRVPVAFEERCEPLGLWLETRAYPLDDGIAIHWRDVTARREREEDLRRREARYRSVFEELGEAMYISSREGRIIEANASFLELFGYTERDLPGLTADMLYADPADRERLRAEIETHGSVRAFEVTLIRRDGTPMPCLLTATAQRSRSGELIGYQGVVHDVTERKREQERLMRSAFHDVLTGLPNRALFLDRLERVVRHAKRHEDYLFAVLFLDLDRFKFVNDTYGHETGDELLVQAARRLQSCLRQEDTIARLGGDEFALILDAIQDLSDATRVADRIQSELSQPFVVGDRQVRTSASIGIALSYTGYNEARDVLRDADAAMYRAKSAGRARFEIFDRHMHERALMRLQLEGDMRQALLRDEFSLLYQPVIHLEDGTVCCVEALVRWEHPTRGMLLPGDFIKIAEETGLMVDIGWWVLREACRQMRQWQDENGAPIDLTVAVNLSSRQFLQQDLLYRLESIFEETGIDPRLLRLELREEAVMQEPQLALDILNQLRSRGIQICLDDFGTGYSSLTHLQRLPITALKIDGSFVRGIVADRKDLGVVQTILALGHTLSIDAVAEGVETVEQLRKLRKLGTKFAQGYLFSTPLDAADVGRLIAVRRRTRSS